MKTEKSSNAVMIRTVFMRTVLTLIFISVLLLPVSAGAEGEKKSYLALGQNLSAEQRQIVLSKLGLTEEDVSSMQVGYITNEMEHKYLDAYIPAADIGTKSISCVLVTEADPGTGIQVTTENISFCTISMYKNALLTSGVTDAKVHVVAPTQVSGTAALVGTWLAYEALTGESLEEDRKDIAVDEIVTIGELSDAPEGEAAVDATTGETISKEVAEELYSYVKAKVVSEGLTDPEKIKALLEEAQTKYNVTLTEEQKAKLSELMPAIGGIQIDPGTLLSQAGDLYDKYGDTVLSNAKELYGEVVTEEVKQSFLDAFKTLLVSILETAKNKIQNH